MILRLKVKLLMSACLATVEADAEDRGTPTARWLEWNRPSIAAQLCDNPRAPFRVSFEGTTQECKAEVDRLFVKCTTEVPNVELPATLMSIDDERMAGIVIYECVSSYHLGGETLEEFERRYPLESQAEAESADE